MSIEQVYVVTSGCYSDYGISSIWLTLEEAQAAVGNDKDTSGYGSRVEVWPIGENQRTLGSFDRSVDLDGTTGKPIHKEQSFDGPDLAEERVTVLCWKGKNTVGIRVTQPTQERADKVYSEVKARVLNDITLGLPVEAIADQQYDNGQWAPIKKAAS